MQLTDQMIAEFDGIEEYVLGLSSFRMSMLSEMITGLTPKSRKFITENSKQLSSYKVRLENLLCETDLKGHVH